MKFFSLTIKNVLFIFLFLFFMIPKMEGQILQTFSYTGAMQSFTMPALCVGPVTLEVWGAQGGANWVNNDNFGGYASAVYSLSAGDVLNVYVGQQPNGITGGFNGGGDGDGAGQGGGGGTDIRLNGITLQDRILVAGGGGGAGYWSSQHVVGGQGGGLVGTDGYRIPNDPGGLGGTQNGGGASGTCINPTVVAMAGGLGYGGTPNGFNCGCEGYGGGGGYFGGAGSGNCRGGGGGSGYILSTAASPSFSTGVRVGHGQARISYVTNGPSVSANVMLPLGTCPNMFNVLNALGVASYTWSNGSNAPSISVLPTVTTTYTVSGTNTNGCVSSAVLLVIANPLPTLTLSTSNTLACRGQSITLTATGASTYVWMSANGPLGLVSTVSATPMIGNSSYTALGTSTAGCINWATISVGVDTLQLTVTSHTAICRGKQVFLTASGTINYTWINNVDAWSSTSQNITPSPSVSTIYTVSGLNANNCILTKAVSVWVNQTPNVTASTSKTLVCKGQPVTISANGANTYSWNINASSAVINVTPEVDTEYSYVVTGTDVIGCIATATLVIKAELCTGIVGIPASGNRVNVFPNPGHGLFYIEVPAGPINRSLRIYNTLGALIKKLDVASGDVEIDLQKEAAGIYFVHLLEGENTISVSKIIKE